jgi:hypothetical protein
MKGKATRKPPQIIFSEGKPRAVIPDIDAGRCLERLDFWQDKSSCGTIFYRHPADLYHMNQSGGNRDAWELANTQRRDCRILCAESH